MQKVDGVQSVRVSLNDGLTILDLKAGNAVTLAKLRQIIKNNGFVSKEATAVARGRRQLVPMEAENEKKRFFQKGWNRISSSGVPSSSC